MVATLALSATVHFGISRTRITLDITIVANLRNSLVRVPGGHSPASAGEALQDKGLLLPFATRFTRTIESTKICVDGTLIGFGS